MRQSALRLALSLSLGFGAPLAEAREWDGAGEPQPAVGVSSWTIPAHARVRLRTVPLASVTGTVLGEREDFATVRLEDSGETVALGKRGSIEGRVVSKDADGIVIAVRDEPPVRIRARDVVGLQYRKRGSEPKGILGALGGALVGMIVGARLSAKSGSFSGGTFLVGGAIGAVGGAFLAGKGSWKSVPMQDRRVVLAVDASRLRSSGRRAPSRPVPNAAPSSGLLDPARAPYSK